MFSSGGYNMSKNNTFKTKECSRGHDKIKFYYISEIEECPLCEALEEILSLEDKIDEKE